MNFFPFGNMRELNLNWFISKWNDFLSEWQNQQSDWQTALSQINSAVASVVGKLDKSITAGRFLYGHNSDTQTEIPLPLSIGNGGTGSSDATAARAALGITTLIDSKLDKRVTAGNKVYTHSDDVQSEKEYQSYPTAGDLAMFNNSGNLQTGTPTQNIEAANKQYVDDLLTSERNYTDGQLGNKVDKQTTVGTFLYGHASSVELEKPYNSTPTANAIAQFNANGNLETGTPTENGEAVNKAYADSLSGNPVAVALEALPLLTGFDYTEDGYYIVNSSQVGVTFNKNTINMLNLGTSSTYRHISLFNNHRIFTSNNIVPDVNDLVYFPLTDLSTVKIYLRYKVTDHTSADTTPPQIGFAAYDSTNDSWITTSTNNYLLVIAQNEIERTRIIEIPNSFISLGNLAIYFRVRRGTNLNFVYSITYSF